MDKKLIDVIIPAYRPGSGFQNLLKRLEKQSLPVRRVLVMNTEEKFWDSRWEKEFPFVEVYHLKKAEFDHGGTRKKAAKLSGADIMVFMTQDALPADENLIENLTAPLEVPGTAAAYARQLPNASCGFVERYTRSFNYPEQSSVNQPRICPCMGSKPFSAQTSARRTKKRFMTDLAVSPNVPFLTKI